MGHPHGWPGSSVHGGAGGAEGGGGDITIDAVTLDLHEAALLIPGAGGQGGNARVVAHANDTFTPEAIGGRGGDSGWVFLGDDPFSGTHGWADAAAPGLARSLAIRNPFDQCSGHHDDSDWGVQQEVDANVTSENVTVEDPRQQFYEVALQYGLAVHRLDGDAASTGRGTDAEAQSISAGGFHNPLIEEMFGTVRCEPQAPTEPNSQGMSAGPLSPGLPPGGIPLRTCGPVGADGRPNPMGDGGNGGSACADARGVDGPAGQKGNSGVFSCSDGGRGVDGGEGRAAAARGGNGGTGYRNGGDGGFASAKGEGGAGGAGGDGGKRTFGSNCAGGDGADGGEGIGGTANGGNGGQGGCAGGNGGTAEAEGIGGAGAPGGRGNPPGDPGESGAATTGAPQGGEAGQGLGATCEGGCDMDMSMSKVYLGICLDGVVGTIYWP